MTHHSVIVLRLYDQTVDILKYCLLLAGIISTNAYLVVCLFMSKQHYLLQCRRVFLSLIGHHINGPEHFKYDRGHRNK